MAAFNKITLIILAFALIAMYFKETNVQIMLLFFAYLSHYPNNRRRPHGLSTLINEMYLSENTLS